MACRPARRTAAADALWPLDATVGFSTSDAHFRMQRQRAANGCISPIPPLSGAAIRQDGATYSGEAEARCRLVSEFCLTHVVRQAEPECRLVASGGWSCAVLPPSQRHHHVYRPRIASSNASMLRRTSASAAIWRAGRLLTAGLFSGTFGRPGRALPLAAFAGLGRPA